LGFLGYINDFSERPIETTHMMVDDEVGMFAVFFNCKKASVEEVLAKPIKRDIAEVSLSQNLLDNFGYPHEIKFDLQELKKDDLFKQGIEEIESKLGAELEAQFRFTKDPITLG